MLKMRRPWPGCPPGLRVAWPWGGAGLGGLTMSEEGGLEEFEESLCAAASCFCNSTTVASRASNRACRLSSCACNRWQFAHGGVASLIMEPDSILPRSRVQHCERLRGMNRYFDAGQHLHGSREACRLHCRAWALLWNFAPWHPATTRKNQDWRCPAERLNQHRYHDCWLQNLLISASHGGYRCPLLQNP